MSAGDWADLQQWLANWEVEHREPRLPLPVVPRWQREPDGAESFAHTDGQWAKTEQPNPRYL